MVRSGYDTGVKQEGIIVQKDVSESAQRRLNEIQSAIAQKSEQIAGLNAEYDAKRKPLEAAILALKGNYLGEIAVWEKKLSEARQKYDDHIQKFDIELARKERELEAVIAMYNKTDSQYVIDKAKLAEQLDALKDREQAVTTRVNVVSVRELEVSKREEEIKEREKQLAYNQNKLDTAMATAEDKLKERVSDLEIREQAVRGMEQSQREYLEQLNDKEKAVKEKESVLEVRRLGIEMAEKREKELKSLQSDIMGKEVQVMELKSDLELLQKALRVKELKLKERERLIKEAQDEIR